MPENATYMDPTEIERYKLISDAASDGIWDWDVESDRLFLDTRYCELIGYSPCETVSALDFLRKIVPSADNQSTKSVLEEFFLVSRDTSVVEHRLIARDGTSRWVESRGKAVEFDEQGKPTRIVGTLVDITPRKKTEDALRHSHTLLSNFSQQVPGALFQTIITPDGHVSTPYSSDKLYDVYEVFPEQLHDNIDAIAERFHPEDRDRIFASIAEATKNVARWECEYRVILPRQGLKWLYGVADLQRSDDGTVYFYGIIMDITERKHLEESLSHSRKLLSSILENAPSAFFVKDVQNDFRIIMWNRAAEQVFGIPAAGMLGKAYDFWPAEQAAAYRNDDREVVSTHRPLDIAEEISSHPDKGAIYLHTRKIPLFDGNGDVSHIVVICDDITEQRMMLAEHLKNQKLESLGVLAGGIAHDFNNILTGVIGNISLAKSLLDESHKAAAVLQKAEKAASRATDLANQLLTFARGGAPVKKAVSLRQFLMESASFVLHGSNVSYDIEVPDNLPAVDVDEGQFHQVINNLIINASQAMPGGGTITITATTTMVDTVNVMALPPGKYVKLDVSDTGCGIAQDRLDKIFDPYYTTKIGGSGLGLASAQSIITRHGGHITVRSVIGSGTTFEILLPASAREIATEKGCVSPPAEVDSQHGFSVLVMDDEAIIRDIAQAMLIESGYHVQTCRNGEEAIALYRAAMDGETPYSATIMDLTIPGGMGGREAAQHILEIDPHARLIVSSGYSTDPVMADYKAFGFCATLQKPYTFDEISQRLGTVLQRNN